LQPTMNTNDYRKWLSNFEGAVFRGKVVDYEPVQGRGMQVTLRVERYWKGVNSAEVVLYTFYGSTCEVRFETGATYLIIARSDGALLRHDSCLGMLAEQNTPALLQALDKGSPPPKR